MEETQQERRKRRDREAKKRRYDANPAEARAKARAFAAKNRDAAKARTAEWRKANPDRVKVNAAITKARRKENWADFLAYERARYAKNPGKKLAQIRKAKALDPAPFAAVLRNHYLRNKPVYKAKVAERRASRIRATPQWCDKAAIIALYCEAQRLTEETGIQHEVDHIIPLRGKGVCGLHIPQNMQILTRTENRRKHNRLTHGEKGKDRPRISTAIAVCGVP